MSEQGKEQDDDLHFPEPPKKLLDYIVTPERHARLLKLESLFAGIPDPEAALREVREVLEFFIGEESQITHDVGSLADKWGYAAEFAKARVLLAKLQSINQPGESK